MLVTQSTLLFLTGEFTVVDVVGLEDGGLEEAEEAEGEVGEDAGLEVGGGLGGDPLEDLFEFVDDFQLDVDEGHLGHEGGKLLADDGGDEGLVVDGPVDFAEVAGGLDAVVVDAEHPLAGLVGVEEGGLDVEGVGRLPGAGCLVLGVGLELVHDRVVPG